MTEMGTLRKYAEVPATAAVAHKAAVRNSRRNGSYGQDVTVRN